MRASIFVGTSVDGFIARRNGDLDFLPADGGEPHGYDEFMATVDTIVIGRATYETVLSFEAWPYGEKRVVVLSSGPVDLSIARARGGLVEQMGGEPSGIVSALAARGAQHLYVDGGVTIQRFLRSGLIGHLVITRVPVLIGDGIPLFGSLLRDVRLRHVATRSYPSGLVQSEYEVPEARGLSGRALCEGVARADTLGPGPRRRACGRRSNRHLSVAGSPSSPSW